MAVYKAGQEIDAYCTKCKMDLLHKIVAVVGGKPVKVECRTCYTTHVYRAPKNVLSPGAVPAAAPAGTGGGGAAPRAPRRAAPAEEAPLIPPDNARIHIYKTTEKFAPEMWIQHKTFGTGQVLREVGPNKIEVRFDGGTRVLIHGLAP
jgi:hypothetical protein